MGGARAEVQVSKKELHMHIHLNYTMVKFLSYIWKKNDDNKLELNRLKEKKN